MRPFHLIAAFMRASLQQELAYRSNFWISLLNSLLSLVVGVLSLQVIFAQVDSLRGWDHSQALTLLGVYLIVSALRGLFIGPSLEELAGMGQEVMTGRFDFTLLRPVDTQFLVTFRVWRLSSLVDLAVGVGVIVAARPVNAAAHLPAFLLALLAGAAVLYSLLLAFTALVFWSPGFTFTWVFDAFFQLARYPVVIYPGWLRVLLTWLVPVGLMTTVPAQALTGSAAPQTLAAGAALALALLGASSLFFRRALRRYASASS